MLKGAFTPPKLGRRIVAELWLYPDGSRILELSTKCLPNEAFQVAAEARAYLQDHGVTIGRDPADEDEVRARLLQRRAPACIDERVVGRWREGHAGEPQTLHDEPREDGEGLAA